MIKYEDWKNPKEWDQLDDEEKGKWENDSKIFVEFYEDMKSARHINTQLDTELEGEALQSTLTFLKIIEDAIKMIDTTNILFEISNRPGGGVEFAKKNQLDPKKLPYLYMSQFGRAISQSHEMLLNILKKTLITDNIKNKKDEPIKETIGKISPIKLMNLLKKDSDRAKDIKNIIESNKDLRNALSHGLIWYENQRIYYADNISLTKISHITFKDFMTKRGRQASLNAECLLWTIKNLVAENFYTYRQT